MAKTAITDAQARKATPKNTARPALKLGRKYRYSHSFSRWDTYLACAYKFFITYVIGRAIPSSVPMTRGSRIHFFSQIYMQHLIDTKEVTDTSVLDDFTLRAWTDPMQREDWMDPEPRLPEENFQEFKETCHKFVTTHQLKPGILGLEMEFCYTEDFKETLFTDWDNCFFRSAIDLARQHDEVTFEGFDYKTGATTKYLKKFQAETYAWAVFKNPRFKWVEKFVLWFDCFMAFGKQPPPHTFYRDTDFEELNKRIMALIETIEDDETFSPTSDPSTCSRCDHKNVCQFYKQVTSGEKKDVFSQNSSADEARKHWIVVQNLAEQHGAAKEAIQHWIENNGPLHLNESELLVYREESSGFIYDIPKLRLALEGLGEDPLEYFSVKAAPIKKLIKNDMALMVINGVREPKKGKWNIRVIEKEE